jgi:DNA-binding IclR family transcriptional regulator
VTALARGLAILQCFTPMRTQLGSAELARATGVPQPTVWRLCQTLVQAGFLGVAPGGQRFQLGTAAMALGFAASAAYDVLEAVRPRLQEFATRFNAAFSVAGRDGLDMVYLQRCIAEAMVGMNLQRGSRIPIVKCTLGWAYLAAVDEPTRDRVLRDIRRAHPDDWPWVEKQVGPALRDCAQKGYVMRRALSHRDIVAIAVPIVASNGTQVLAVNCSGHTGNVTARQLENEVAPLLKEVASAIGGAISGGVLALQNLQRTVQ